MQTFLPYADFEKSAKSLDMKRLGKQRVEVMQILQTIAAGDAAKGWKNHPAVKMWRGHEDALAQYGVVVCDEWISRGYKDTCRSRIWTLCEQLASTQPKMSNLPAWVGDEKFHASHRSNLLRKKPEYYLKFGWTEPADIEYVWPE